MEIISDHVHDMVRTIANCIGTGRDLSRNELNQKTDDISVVTGRDLSLLSTLPTLPTMIPTSKLPIIPAIRKIKSLSDIIGAFKTTSSKDIHLAGFLNFFWQRSFYERIIRSEGEACKIRRYIRDNPANWECDDENPKKK